MIAWETNLTIDARSLKFPSKKLNWKLAIWHNLTVMKAGPAPQDASHEAPRILPRFPPGISDVISDATMSLSTGKAFLRLKKNVQLPGFQECLPESNAATPAEPPPSNTRSYPLFPGLQWRDGFGGCPILQQMNHLEIHRSALFEQLPNKNLWNIYHLHICMYKCFPIIVSENCVFEPRNDLTPHSRTTLSDVQHGRMN